MGKVFQILNEYQDKNIYPFHMPGHKRNMPESYSRLHMYEIDYTEIDGLDDLHEPEEMYRASMDEMKEFYQTKETFYLVNGSTSGIMAAITASCKIGDTIIISRNCHKSVYKAIELLGLKPVYIYPRMDEKNGNFIDISVEDVRKIVDKYPEASAFMLVSPTYEGMVMNISAIAAITKQADITFIVDEAHGAHFPFGEDFPESAIGLGADIVIQSLHKTMPALTQTALMHICTDRISIKEAKEAIQYFETTSPSYLLAASIDDAFLFGKNHKDSFHEYYLQLMEFRKKAKTLNHLYILEVSDPGKIVISTEKCNMTGKQLYDILLKKYKLQMEMAQENYCLAMTSVCDTREGFNRLLQALFEIDKSLMNQDEKLRYENNVIKNELVYIPYEAKHMEKIWLPLDQSVGFVSGVYVYVYPPGIPLLVPGERISKDVIRKIKLYKEASLKVNGIKDVDGLSIQIICE